MLQFSNYTPRALRITLLLTTGLLAFAFTSASATGNDDNTSEVNRDYHEAIIALKAYYAEQSAYDKALQELADYLAAEEKDLFDMDPNVQVFNSDLELVEEFTTCDEAQVFADDSNVFMVYGNTTYVVQ